MRVARRPIRPAGLLPVFMLAGVLAPLGAQTLAGDDNWAVFHGNSQQTGVARSFLPETIAVRWIFKTKGALSENKDPIESTAAIAHGTAYVASLDEHVYAIDLASGKEKWNFKAGSFKASVGLQGSAVYAGDIDGIFHCLDAANGQERWKYDTGTGAEITSGPNFSKEGVLFGGEETLYCASNDGKLRWKFKVPGGPVMGSPAIIGNRTFAAGCDSTLHVIDTATGKEVAAGVDLGGQVGATVAVLGERLYVGTMSSQVLGIDWKKGSILWTFAAENRQQPFFSSPAATRELIVVGSRDKHLYALRRENGKMLWSFQARNKVDSSPVIVGKRVFVGSQDGNLYVLDLDKGTELQRLHLGSAIAASPAVAEDCLVIGNNDGEVYCLGAKK
jgi:outer membrane protein assembly factor BamB